MPKCIISDRPPVEDVDSPPMKKSKIRYALRAHRRSVGLSQKEVATLLGLESAAHVCHIEQGTRDPSFSIACACSALYDAPLSELFPHTAKEAEDGLKERAGRLCKGMRCSSTPHAAHKAKFLSTVPCTTSHALMHDGDVSSEPPDKSDLERGRFRLTSASQPMCL